MGRSVDPPMLVFMPDPLVLPVEECADFLDALSAGGQRRTAAIDALRKRQPACFHLHSADAD